jgi:hypothetical protein
LNPIGLAESSSYNEMGSIQAQLNTGVENMKTRIIIVFLVAFGCFGLIVKSNLRTTTAQTEDKRVPPTVVVLGKDAKLGQVTFNHGNHITKNYNVEGTAPLACVECHHVERAASEVAEAKPPQMAYPSDRTVTLTLESLKDATTPLVTTCRSCHIQRKAEPTLLSEIPKIINEKTGKAQVLNNQNAFHRKCSDCHNAARKLRPDANAPKSIKCLDCHKRS